MVLPLSSMAQPTVLALAAVAVAAALPAFAQTRPAEADIDRAESAWRAVAPADYTITLLVHAFSPGSGRPFTVHVVDGDARLVGSVPDGAESLYRRYDSVDHLFALVRDALDSNADRLAVTFHPTLGYPTFISLDPRLNMMHDGLQLQVLDLRGNPPLPGEADAPSMPSVVSSNAVVSLPMRTGLRTAPVSAFIPAIPAVDNDGRCEPVTPADSDSGRLRLAYAFGPRARPVRRIEVLFEHDRVLRYVDNRGDIRPYHDASISAADPPGPRTVIMIDWVRQRGDFANLVGRQPVVEIRSTGPDVLTAENLGVPSDIVAMISARCSSSLGQ